MKTVKKNQYNKNQYNKNQYNKYNKYNNRNNNRHENIVITFNIIAYTAMILLAYSAYYIIFEVIPSGKLG